MATACPVAGDDESRFVQLSGLALPARIGLNEADAHDIRCDEISSPTNVNGDVTMHLWTCPICATYLGDIPEEIGALCYQGVRIEKDLYHMGCVSQMLIHSVRSGQGSIERSRGKHKVSSVSPMTRKPVDGFLPMPKVEDVDKWVAFVDWKGDDRINAGELLDMCHSSLPVKREPMESFLCEVLDLGSDNIGQKNITRVELKKKLWPYIRDRCEEDARIREARANILNSDICKADVDGTAVKSKGKSAVADAIRSISKLSPELRYWGRDKTLLQLRALCTQWNTLQRQILISSVCRYLEAGVCDVAIAARAIMDFVPLGHRRTVMAAVKLLRDVRLDVRQQALNLLARIATPPLDKHILKSVRDCLMDPAPTVKAAALVAFVELSAKDDDQVLQAVSTALADEEAVVRTAAGQVLSQIPATGNTFMVGKLIAQLQAAAEPIRMAAIKPLVQISLKDDDRVVKAIVARLSVETVPLVRRALVSALAKITQKSNKRVIRAIERTLKNADTDMSEFTLKALPQIACRGDASAIKIASAYVLDERNRVAVASLHALGELVYLGDWRTLKLATSALQGSKTDVQIAAVCFIERAADIGDSVSIQVLKGLISHNGDVGLDPRLQRTAELALQRLSGDAERPSNGLEPPPLGGVGRKHGAGAYSRCCFCNSRR